MESRLARAMAFNRDELQAGIDEAEEEIRRLQGDVARLEELVRKGRLLLEGGTADLTSGTFGRRLTLHEAIREVLKERDNHPASAREIVEAINKRDLYRKRDGTSVEINQIHARVNNYGSMFEKTEDGIRLKDTDSRARD